MINSIEKAKKITKSYHNFLENYSRFDNTKLSVFLSIQNRTNNLHDFIKQNTPAKELRKKVARIRKLVKRINSGELKNSSMRFKNFNRLITLYKIDNIQKQKEHNVFEFTNEHFTAQYTTGKNGKGYKRLLGVYNYKPCFGKWIETTTMLINNDFKKECSSLYINHRL